jgi:hypothetical protein
MAFLSPGRHNSAKFQALTEMLKFIAFLASHGIAMAVGFASGIYLLPIPIAPNDRLKI